MPANLGGAENFNEDPYAIIILAMTALALLFTLSAIGISETVYLVRKRIASERPVCPIGGGCEKVLNSKYGRLFIIPNDILGLAFYIAASFITAFLVIGVPPAELWFMIVKAAVLGASLMSLVLFYLQWKVLKAWCFWCIMSAITIWLMGIILIVI